MRSVARLAAGVVATLLVLPTGPANAMDACWPACVFGPSKSVSSGSGSSNSERSSERRRAKSESGSSSSNWFSGGSVGSGGGSTGVASYYWQPQQLASGGQFNPNAMTAAHKTLPFGTRVRVTNLGNGRSVDVTINDRGPYIGGRIIDLSKAAAGSINMQGQGVAQVRMEVIGR